jgi:alpha-L-fucosidase
MAATTIISGMTPSEYLTAVNANFHSVETTVLNTMQGSNFKTAFEGNYDAVKAIIPSIATKESLIVGSSASKIISDLNSNYSKINDVIGNPTTDNNLMTLVHDGTKIPVTQTNQYLNKFMAYKLGGLIQYSMWSYGGLLPTLYTGCPVASTSFYTGTHDVRKWVSDAHDAGIEYLVLSVMDGSNFSLFDNPIRFPDYILNSVFGYNKYDITSIGGDTAIVDKFYAACIEFGIEPIPYFCPYHSANLYKTITGGINPPIYSTTQRQYYDNFTAKVIQYFLTTWASNYIHIDVSGGTIANTMQTYYDAVKAINPNCQVCAYTIGDIDLNWFPYDIGSNEEWYSGAPGDHTWAAVLSSSRAKGGTTYYIPQEIIANNNVYGEHYYYHTGQTRRTQAAIQDIYDIAKANSVPFCLNLAPDRVGVISTEQYNFFKNLTL